ncbi:sphingosine N-acyltransferase lag1, partial [Ascosphaera atra]
YLWTTSPYWLNFRAIWADWPIRHTSGAMKAYTLSQLGFWFHQIVVLNVEERRKDYGQMLFHHIITSGLLGAAYVYGFFNVANVVLCLMDVVDLLLPVGLPCY